MITGPREIGKTTLCARLTRSLPMVDGVISPAMYDQDGRKIGFACRNIGTGESLELGRSDLLLDGPGTGRYSFSRDVLEKAVAWIEGALTRKAGVTMIDEIGPLELRRGLGFSPVLGRLASAGDLILVVREELLPELAELIPGHRHRKFRLSTGNREQADEDIIGFLTHPSENRADRRPS